MNSGSINQNSNGLAIYAIIFAIFSLFMLISAYGANELNDVVRDSVISGFFVVSTAFLLTGHFIAKSIDELRASRSIDEK